MVVVQPTDRLGSLCYWAFVFWHYDIYSSHITIYIVLQKPIITFTFGNAYFDTLERCYGLVHNVIYVRTSQLMARNTNKVSQLLRVQRTCSQSFPHFFPVILWDITSHPATELCTFIIGTLFLLVPSVGKGVTFVCSVAITSFCVGNMMNAFVRSVAL